MIISDDFFARCSEVVVGAGALTVMGGVVDVDSANAGLQAMAPEEDHVIRASEVDASGGSMDAIGERIGNLRAGIAPSTGLALRLNGRPATAEDLLGYDAVRETGQSASADGMGSGGWGVFLDGGFATGDKDATLNEPGFDMDAVQLTLGVDYRMGNQLILGGAAGYTQLDANIDAGGGEAESEGYSLFAFGSYYPSDSVHVDLIVGYAKNDIDQERNIRYTVAGFPGPGTTTVNQTAFSDSDSDEISARVTVGYDFYDGNDIFGPYARLEYARTEIDGYRETINSTAPGSGLAVQMDDQDFTSVPLALGFQASTAVDTSWATLYPQAFVEYVHEFANDSEKITGHFVNDASQTKFFLPTDSPDRNVFQVGLTLAALFDNGLSGHLSYQSLIGHKDITLHAFEVGVRVDF